MELASFSQLDKKQFDGRLAPVISYKLTLHGRGGPFYAVHQILVRKRQGQTGYYPVCWAVGLQDKNNRAASSYISRETDIYQESLDTSFVITMFSGLLGNYWQVDSLLPAGEKCFINGSSFSNEDTQPLPGLPPFSGTQDKLTFLLRSACHALIPSNGEEVEGHFKVLPVPVLKEFRREVDRHRALAFQELPGAMARRADNLVTFVMSMSGYTAIRDENGNIGSLEGDLITFSDMMLVSNGDWNNIVLHHAFLKDLREKGHNVPTDIYDRYKTAWDNHVAKRGRPRAKVELPKGVVIDVDGVAYLEDEMDEVNAVDTGNIDATGDVFPNDVREMELACLANEQAGSIRGDTMAEVVLDPYAQDFPTPIPSGITATDVAAMEAAYSEEERAAA